MIPKGMELSGTRPTCRFSPIGLRFSERIHGLTDKKTADRNGVAIPSARSVGGDEVGVRENGGGQKTRSD